MISTARADVASKTVDGNNFIVVSNEIIKGDHTRFEQIATALNGPAIVLLNSRGGALFEGLMIGEEIRTRGYKTMILSDSICASSCSLIWLAGATRYAGTSARIGFHAAYIGTGNAARETGVGNAIVGAYLTKLNLSYAAIEFATSAPPSEVRWLRPADAEQVGIHYVTLPDDHAPALPMTVGSTKQAGSPTERRIRRLVVSYYAALSGTGTDVTGLSKFYSDTVSSFGVSVTLPKLMAEKQKFAVRWPTRQYNVEQSTVLVQCGDTCAVTGVVDWNIGSADRNVRSIGSANFVLKILPMNAPIGEVIVSENASVLSRHIEPLAAGPVAATVPTMSAEPDSAPSTSAEQEAALATPGYAEGRQARIAYEQWFAALLDGPYKNGVVFWAANRSIKPSLSCIYPNVTVDWQAGCAASKAFFAAVDLRRETEKNYWWGWNSV